jgi:hypothetical protein
MRGCGSRYSSAPSSKVRRRVPFVVDFDGVDGPVEQVEYRCEVGAGAGLEFVLFSGGVA